MSHAAQDSRSAGFSLNAYIKAITPEGIEFNLSPAGFSVRTFAYAVDKIIQWLILIIISVLFMYLLKNLTGVWIIMILNFCIEWFYHVICDIFFRGQSPGKRFMGLRVVKSDGSPVDPGSSFLRNLLRFADTFFCLFHIAFVSIAASEGFRRIGDWAAGTLVVYLSIAKKPARDLLYSLLEKYEPVSPARALSSDEKQAILNFARRYPLLGEARANEIAGIYAPLIKNESGNSQDAAFLLGIARRLSGEIL